MKTLTIPVLHGASGDSPDELDTLATAGAVQAALGSLGHHAPLVRLDAGFAAIRRLAVGNPDLVFNLVDAVGGDGALAAEVPGELDRHSLAHTGCGARASQACVSKPGMKRIMRGAGLPTPTWSLTGADMARLPQVIVKAVSEHASIGMDARSVVPGPRAPAEILDRGRRFGTRYFAEEFIEGREFNLSLLSAPDGAEVLPPAEIRFVGYPANRPKIVDYDAKWVQGAFGFAETPRSFDFGAEDRPLLAELSDMALRAWRLFGLSGYARVDFRVDGQGRPWILEVNTNPCLAPDAGFVAAAATAGMEFADVIARIVSAAMPAARAA